MSTIKETSTYWFHEILEMVKQLGIPTYFMNLSSVDLIFHKMPRLIKRDKQLQNLSYQEHCTLLKDNLVLVARLFQYKALLKDLFLITS